MSEVSAAPEGAPLSTAAFLCLLAGGCAIAFAPILVRLSDTGPVASAFWRTAYRPAPTVKHCYRASACKR